MRIVTVLRSGGEYRPAHVEVLRELCLRHAPGVEFACLSDLDVPGRIPLRHAWLGWWSKIELFALPGPLLYMDLDTVPCGDLAPLLQVAAREPWVALRDFNPAARLLGSGLMAWSGSAPSGVYEGFCADPAGHIARNSSGRWLGDQGFIERTAPRPAFWQILAPGAVVSWKKDCKAGVPRGSRVICFHGRPRPWQTDVYTRLAA